MKSHFKGGAELEAALKALGDKGAIRRTAERGLKRAAEPIRDEAKRLAPDDPETGPGKYLRESIKIGKRAEVLRGNKNFRKSATGRKTIETWVGIDGSVKPPKTAEHPRKRKGGGSSGGSVAAYSIFTEFGTGTHTAQPFMRPAFDNMKQHALDILAEVVGEEIVKTAGRQARKRAKLGG